MGKITFLVISSFLFLFLLASSVSFTKGNVGSSVEISISGEIKNVTCNGAGDGLIDVAISGGVEPYSISWTGSTGTSRNLTSLAGGTYTITVTDAEEATKSATFEVEEPEVLNISSSTVTAVSCNGGNDGTIKAGNVTGGTAPYEYSINNNFSPSDTFTDLPGGTYTLTVKDANGCMATEDIIVGEPVVLEMAAPTSTPVSCHGESDGTVTAGEASGGNGDYQYSIDGTSFTTSNTFNGLSAGNYTVTVKDSKDCTATASVEVTQPDVLTMAAPTSTPVSCHGQSDGTVTAGEVSGGNGGFQYSIDGINFSNSDSFHGLAAGTYTVTVKDSEGCTATASVEVTQPDELTLAAPTFTPVSCHGQSDGTVTAGEVLGGNGDYQYSIDGTNFTTSNIFNGLSAGNYTVTIKDAEGCTATASVEVTQPEVLTMAAPIFTPVSCHGASDGTVTSGEVSGGNGDYQYSIDGTNFTTSNIFNGLSAGNHTVTIKDAEGCTATASVEVTQPDELILAAPTFTPVSCHGASDGTITAGSVSGGNGEYTFSIEGSNFFSSDSFTGLSAGNYTVTVKDAEGCTATASVEVTQPGELTATLDSTDLTCSSINDGTITISAPQGGNGTYQYSINNGTSWVDTGNFSGLSEGSYQVLIRDKAFPDCAVMLEQYTEIAKPSPLTADVSGQNVSCKDAGDGMIIISNSAGGQDAFEYSIDGNNWQTGEVFENLQNGSYTVQMRDAQYPDCRVTLETAVEITEPEKLEANLESKTDILCNGFATGEITVSATGGTAPYTYSWGSLGFGETKSDLPAGNYTVTVTDANGCEAEPLTVEITEPDTFVDIVSTYTTSGCYQADNGTATVEVEGGVGNYTYLWSNGQTSKTATGLAPGSHTVTVTDENGCEKSRTVTVSAPTELKINGFLTTETTTYGSATGTATAQVSGGSPGYTFSWSNGQTGQTATNLKAGTYSVTVKDKNGCTVTRDVVIIDTLDATIVPTSICEGEEEIVRTSYFEVEDLTARGGTAGYTYSWDFGEYATPATATGPGPHQVKYSVIGDKRITLKVTDSKGLTLEKQIIQYVGGCFSNDCGSNDLQAENYFVGDEFGNKITNQNCAEAGQKYLYIVFPTNSERYSLNIEYIYSVKNLSTGDIFNDREAGCFYRYEGIPTVARTIPIDYNCGDVVTIEGIYLTFSNNNKWDCGQGPNPKCYSTNNETSVSIPLYAVAFPNDLLCNGGLNGIINARASGGSGEYTYKLISTTDGSTVKNYQTSSSFTGLPAGKYKVVVNDGNEEYTTVEVEIKQPVNRLNLELTSFTELTCYGGSDGSATVQASGGTPIADGEPYIYVWENGETTASVSNLSAGEYTVTAIDANGCEIDMTVTIEQPEEVLAVAGPDQVLTCGTTSTQLQAELVTDQGDSDYEFSGEWTIVNGPAGGNFEDPTDPTTTFNGTQGTYTLRWTVTCGDSDDVKITFSHCSTIDFDGIDDHILFEDDYDLPENFSLEAWVKQDATVQPGIRTILSKRDNSNPGTAGYDLIVEDNIPKFRWNNSTLASQHPIGSDRWYHIAVIKGGEYAGLYVDGIKVSAENATPGSPDPNSQPFLIGAVNNDATPVEPDNYFHGWIEEVRIWNSSLTLEQLHFMMNQKLKESGGMVRGLEIPIDVPGGLSWNTLAGYYQLEKIQNGYTIAETAGSPKGQLINIKTTQQRTAPLPYISDRAGAWFADATWLRPQVWDPPHSIGIDGETKIDWNIARISHNISSGGKDIMVLGLLSKGQKLTIANPNHTLNEKNSGQSLTVTHYLELNGVIDLIGESQLVQTDVTEHVQTITSILEEASTGYIERDQQGTANSYNYNYWSSPVSLRRAANNSTYTIASVMKDGTATNAPKDLSFGTQYHFADGGYSNPRKISNYWLHKFRGTANVYSDWEHVGKDGTLHTGEGYTMKGTSGGAKITDPQNYVFTGKPNNGTITLTIGQDQNYLLGNPYPSAIDINTFILENLNRNDVGGATNTANIFNGAVYFWDHFAGKSHILKEYIGGYATRNLIGGVKAISTDERVNATEDEGNKIPGRYIPVAQGFFINTTLDPDNGSNVTVDGGDIVFSNNQRVFVPETDPDDSQFLKPEIYTKASKETDTRAKIRLDFKSPMRYNRQILVGADPNTTDGFDLGYDAAMNDNSPEDMYWLIKDREYVIQGVPDFNLDRVLPLGIKISKKGEFTVKINELKNVDDDVNIFLRDKEAGKYFNLRKEGFSLTLEPKIYHDRFEIVFEEKTIPETPEIPEEEEEEEEETPGNGETPGEGEKPGEGDNGGGIPEEGSKGEIQIVYLTGDKELLIKNPHLIKINEVRLLTLPGQILEEHPDVPVQKEVRIPVRSYNSAVYMVRMNTSNGIIQKKIIINN